MELEIKKNLNNTLRSGMIPEIGQHRTGKVRDVHFTGNEIGDPIIMVASDRVSCFDHVLSRQIPFKGKVLNLLTKWAFKNTKDIVDNALIETPHENILVQELMKKIDFEFVVRGYMWGSMAESYEKGEREFCGYKLPNDMNRYQKLNEPMFTPATKEEEGHDINVSFEYMADKLGRKLSEELRDITIKLYKRASELAEKKGYIFIDTKYEFGLDKHNKIHLIDEANTPDSSRYCRISELEKYTKIKELMAKGKYGNVTELLEDNPKLKIKELSKQFVRDVLVEGGFSGYTGEGSIPDLTDENIIETSRRYISLYEELTGQKFDFGSARDVRSDLIAALRMEGLITGAVTVIMAGSDSDMNHIKKITNNLDEYGIKSIVRICSAHKQPAEVESIVKQYNDSIEPLVIVAVAGGTDALSGTASFHSVYPVVSCPPDAENFKSCIDNPPGSSNSLVLKPANCARHIAQILGQAVPSARRMLLKKNEEKVRKLEEADGA